MDILASMFAYLVCVTGIVTGLAMSFVVFFATPAQQSAVSGYAIAVLAKPSATQTARASAEKPNVTIKQRDEHVASGAAKAEAVPPMTIAIDARQKPLFSQSHFRRLVVKERARHLAYRERSSFETRFLGYDD